MYCYETKAISKDNGHLLTKTFTENVFLYANYPLAPALL